MLKRLLLLFMSSLLVTGIFASHFRYGLVTATRLSETSTTVTYRLNVSEAWRLGNAPGSSNFNISGGNSGVFNVPMTAATDPSGGWTNNSGSAVVTLNKTAIPTRIEFTSCCKVSNTINNHDASWDEYIILNTNAPGSSPVSTLPAIINMPVNATNATYTIPASDPDAGSTLTYGLPNFASGPLAGQTEPPGFSVNATTGQITVNTFGKAVGQLYNAMVTVTDNDGNQIMLDFIINIVGASNPPEFDYNVMPANGFVYNVIAGQNISFPIRATDPDLGSTVKLSVSGLPAYITTGNFSPLLPATGNPSMTTFSWTPAAAQIGTTNILNFIATDNVGVQSSTSVTIKVVAEPAPVFISPTPAQSSLRQIVTGQLFQDQIVAQSTLGSNVSIAFANVPTGVSLSPSVPTTGANPGQTTASWTPTPANFGMHNFSFQAVISAVPTIFASRSYSVVVNTPPVFSSMPSGLTLNAGESFSYAITVADQDIPYGDVIDIHGTNIPSWLTLTSTGNGTAILSGTSSFADGGIHHVVLEAEDIYHHGNPASVEQAFDIQVITCVAPAIVCPSNITVSNSTGSCAALVTYPDATITGSTPVITYSIASGSLFTVGATLVTVTATNDCGTASCSFTVTVTDNEQPVITAPANVSVNNDLGVCGAVVALGTPVTGDNCGVAGVTNNAPSVFPVGQTMVTWTVTDVNGNTQSAQQKVVVTDNEAPKALCKPVTVTLVNGQATITAASINNNSTDNCAIASLEISKSSFTCANIGSNNPVTLKVTDIYGNVATCSANVTVVGEIPSCSIASVPTSSVFTGGNANNLYLGYGAQSTNLQVTPAANGAPYTYAWSGSAINLLSSSTSGSPVFTPVAAGQYTFTVVTTNKYGCSTSCSITICVTDIRVPGTNGSKVYVCHLPPGNTGNAQTLSISVNAVPAHLGNHTGDRLGTCSQTPCSVATGSNATNSTASQSVSQELNASNEDLKVTVSPNPSSQYFTLKLTNKFDQSVQLKVMDATGRMVEARSNIQANSTITVGHNFTIGTYFAEITQGTRRVVIQLMKVK